MPDSSATAQDILKCARSLLAAGGYDSFSYADIAKIVGIRNASIHYHFPAKSDLVRVLVKQYREEAEAGMAELSCRVPEPLGQLRAYIGYWEACIGDGSAPLCICALLASQMPILPEAVASEVRSYFNALSAWLAQVLQTAAQNRTIQLTQPADAEAESFMATVHGAMLSARAYGDAKVFSKITQSRIQRLARTGTR